jgi:hypothetical protein
MDDRHLLVGEPTTQACATTKSASQRRVRWDNQWRADQHVYLMAVLLPGG